MTYRERREARAERLETWANRRESNSQWLHEHAVAEVKDIPFGQPILVGHHSEKRARAVQARFVSRMDKAIENDKKAERMQGRAEGIRDQLDRAIYSDDPDAIEQLRIRIRQLEDRRTDFKERNAEFRATHKDELKAETNSYKRDCMMPAASFTLTNLGANILRNKKRLAQLERKAR